ncbi:pentapeptide repeat-containing protein [Roseivirga sp. BDSF3-8]|uniref:pentapeptide repeat-containing protein n=1 Tax=Roseivirga sp. BDSF3-8 TaxID=3241598 RepID=UPI003531BC71
MQGCPTRLPYQTLLLHLRSLLTIDYRLHPHSRYIAVKLSTDSPLIRQGDRLENAKAYFLPRRSDFRRPDFRRSDFRRSDFRRPDFRRSDFRRPDFRRSDFRRPDCQ